MFSLADGNPAEADRMENTKLGRIYYFWYMKRVKNLNQLLSALKK